MKYSKRVLSIIAVAIFGISMVACAGSITKESEKSKSPALPTKSTTIELMTSWGGVDSKAGSLKEIIAKFENENSTIKISNQSIFGDEYLPTLKT